MLQIAWHRILGKFFVLIVSKVLLSGVVTWRNVDVVTAAILGLSVLLISGVVTWNECLGEVVAWDTLTWFAALIAMAGYLNKYALISRTKSLLLMSLEDKI